MKFRLNFKTKVPDQDGSESHVILDPISADIKSKFIKYLQVESLKMERESNSNLFLNLIVKIGVLFMAFAESDKDRLDAQRDIQEIKNLLEIKRHLDLEFGTGKWETESCLRKLMSKQRGEE